MHEDSDAASGATPDPVPAWCRPGTAAAYPLALAFYDAAGQRIVRVPETDAAVRSGLIELREPVHVVRLHGLAEKPLPAFLQGLSAPVRLDMAYQPDELVRLAQVEPDPLTRWEALQRLRAVWCWARRPGRRMR